MVRENRDKPCLELTNASTDSSLVVYPPRIWQVIRVMNLPPCPHADEPEDLGMPTGLPGPTSSPGTQGPKAGAASSGSVAFAPWPPEHTVLLIKAFVFPWPEGSAHRLDSARVGPVPSARLVNPSGGLVPSPSFSHVLSRLQVRVPGGLHEGSNVFQKKKKGRNSIKIHLDVLGVCATTKTQRLSH